MSTANEAISGNSWGLEPMLDVGDLAACLGVPVSTVYDWRTHGKGPSAYRFGKHLKFAVSDVRTWVEQQRESLPTDGR
jgi:excisionase family DNA binding protein